ncbi:hypothetical protein [Maricaulis sp.]|uniref:hypothetical protein n=1 Tax=Maricaulis sp. TaxID=1486257 RepID=UPI003A91C294
MAQAYSMEGFEIRIDGHVLEMRTEGTRTAAMGRDPGRSFQSFMANSDIGGIVFDVRGAQYEFTDFEWEERARVLARLCHHVPTAIICRPDQTGQVARITEQIDARGGVALACRSRQAARTWLDSRVPSNVTG